MRSRVRAFAALCCALVLTTTGCGGGGGGDGPGAADASATESGGTLRLALSQPTDHPSYVALDHLADRFAKATNGRWKIKIFPNENLGAQQEAVQLTRNGTVDMAVISGPQLESIEPDFAVLNLPGIFSSVEHQMKVVDDDRIVGGLYERLERKGRLSVLGGFTQGPRSIYADKPVTRSEALKGMKIRTQESAVQSGMVARMGGAPTPMAYGEIYTALQSGVLDGAENNEVSYVTQKHYEVAKHFSRTEHLIGLDYLAVNSDRLARMAPRDRTLLRRASDAAVREFTGLWKSETAQAVRTARSKGAHFHTVDDAAFAGTLERYAEETLHTATERHVYEAARAVAP